MNKLEQVLVAQRAQFDALAAVWLQANATAFGIAQNGRDVMSWSREMHRGATRIHALIVKDNCLAGELWVQGLDDAAARARLEMDASLVARWLQLEAEIDTMTADLIDAQDQLLALYDLNKALRKFFTLGELLNALVSEAARLIQCGNAFVIFQEPNGRSQIAQTRTGTLDEPQISGLFENVSQSRKRLLLRADEANGLIPLAQHNVLCVPVRVKEKIQGALGWLDKAQGTFTSPDIKLAQAIAEQAGAEIENVLLYNESLAQARLKTELELAHNIQHHLLPQTLPRIPGLDLYAHMLPALQVGGDFYDLINTPKRPFCLTLGDVSGKGMSAALVMAIVRTSLRIKARFMPNATPADMLTRLTEELYDDLTEMSMFATTFVAQFNHARSELVYANAGHAPVIFLPRGGAPQLLEADSTPLGVLPLSLAENFTIPLAPGDVLVVATDGFSEARNPDGEMFGIPGLMEAIQTLAPRTAREISDALFERIAEYSQGTMDDDQTLVIVKRIST